MAGSAITTSEVKARLQDNVNKLTSQLQWECERLTCEKERLACEKDQVRTLISQIEAFKVQTNAYKNDAMTVAGLVEFIERQIYILDSRVAITMRVKAQSLAFIPEWWMEYNNKHSEVSNRDGLKIWLFKEFKETDDSTGSDGWSDVQKDIVAFEAEWYLDPNRTYDKFVHFIVYEGVTRITLNMFEHHVKTVTMHDRVTDIEESTFKGCSKLEYAILPKSLRELKKRTLLDCESLYFVYVPEQVETIGESALMNCKSLAHMSFPDSVTSLRTSVLQNCNSLQSVVFPTNVGSISAFVCYGCTNLLSITIPESTCLKMSIGKYAFYQCSALKSIIIPKQFATLGNQAFGQCVNLKSVTLPNAPLHIAKYAFHGCNDLDTVAIHNDGSWDPEDLIIETVRLNPWAFAYAYRSDIPFIIRAIRSNANTFEYIDDSLKRDHSIIRAFFETFTEMVTSSTFQTHYFRVFRDLSRVYYPLFVDVAKRMSQDRTPLVLTPYVADYIIELVVTNEISTGPISDDTLYKRVKQTLGYFKEVDYSITHKLHGHEYPENRFLMLCIILDDLYAQVGTMDDDLDVDRLTVASRLYSRHYDEMVNPLLCKANGQPACLKEDVMIKAQQEAWGFSSLKSPDMSADLTKLTHQYIHRLRQSCGKRYKFDYSQSNLSDIVASLITDLPRLSFKLSHDIITCRGVKTNGVDSDTVEKYRWSETRPIHPGQFISTSLDKTICDKFGDKVMRIIIPAKTKVMWIAGCSVFSYENEVLITSRVELENLEGNTFVARIYEDGDFLIADETMTDITRYVPTNMQNGPGEYILDQVFDRKLPINTELQKLLTPAFKHRGKLDEAIERVLAKKGKRMGDYSSVIDDIGMYYWGPDEREEREETAKRHRVG